MGDRPGRLRGVATALFLVAALAPHPSVVHRIDGRRWCAPSAVYLLPGDPGPRSTPAEDAEYDFDMDCGRIAGWIVIGGGALLGLVYWATDPRRRGRGRRSADSDRRP